KRKCLGVNLLLGIDGFSSVIQRPKNARIFTGENKRQQIVIRALRASAIHGVLYPQRCFADIPYNSRVQTNASVGIFYRHIVLSNLSIESAVIVILGWSCLPILTRD